MGCEAAKRSVVAALVVGGILCLVFWAGRLNGPASAQAQPPASENGRILVIPVQIARDSHGLAMVDTAAQTLWIYEINLRGPAHKRLNLLAARSWRHDRRLEQYNTGEPTPEQVKSLLDNPGRLLQQPDPGKHILEMAEPDERAFDIDRRDR